MTKFLKVILVMGFFVLGLYALSFSQEENITITTYYPSPFGSYRELETRILYFAETVNGLIAFRYPNVTYDRRLRITAGLSDTLENDQGASIDLHGNLHANAGRLDLVAGRGGDLTFWSSPAGNNALERMRIDDAGNVGIGGTAPPTKLEIVNEGVTDLASHYGMAVRITQNIASAAGGPKLEFYKRKDSGSVKVWSAGILQGLDVGDFAISEGGGCSTGYGNPKLVIQDTTGNVGIGTSTPGAKLAVVGTRDVPQVLIRANATQTNANPLILLQNSAGTELMRIHSNDVTNTFIGDRAGANDTLTANPDEGKYNAAFGGRAMLANTTGYANAAFGYSTLLANTTGHCNTALGYVALRDNTTGMDNSAVGYGALYQNTTGSENNAIGDRTLQSNTTGSRNSGLGHRVLQANTTGYNNSAIGHYALYSNTTGYANTAAGFQTLYSNTTGFQNTATGIYASYRNTTGRSNTATGGFALYTNTTGDFNTATGDSALMSNGTGYFNTAIGTAALCDNTTGYQNTGAGGYALRSNTTGYSNTALGYMAGYLNSSGLGNIFLGYQAGYNETGSNKLYIDNSNTTAPLIYGDFSANSLIINGNFNVTGTKTFLIKHPLKKNMQLVHACLEGPESAVFYRGEARLVQGRTAVKLPDYFEVLTRKEGRTVQLTAKGKEPYLLSYTDIVNGEFTVYGTKTDGEFAWEVKAARADLEPLQVEEPEEKKR